MPHLTALKADRLRGTTALPGDRSISHQALILAGLTAGRSLIDGLNGGDNLQRMMASLRQLGIGIEAVGPDRYRVDGVGIGALAEPSGVLDLGASVIAASLLPGVLASHPLTAVLSGDRLLHHEPLNRVIDPLIRLGARITSRGGRLPLTITGAREPLPIDYRLPPDHPPIPATLVKSALLLAGLNTPGQTAISEKTASRDHSERLLAHFGAEVSVTALAGGGQRVAVTGQPELMPTTVTIPGDFSAAAVVMVAALIVPGSDVILTGVGLNPGRCGLLTSLIEMGGDITILDQRLAGGEPVGDLRICHSSLRAISIPASRAVMIGDEYPALAVAAAFANGESRLDGLGDLRRQGHDPLSALAGGLRAAGVPSLNGPDGLTISGRAGAVAGGARLDSFSDPQLAMAFLVLGLGAQSPVTVSDSRLIDPVFPGFAATLGRLGAQLTNSGA